MTALTVRELVAGHAGQPVVRGVSLTVTPGEVTALLGANGAGKSTTLLTLSGLIPALGGEVRVLGEPLATGRGSHRMFRRGLGFVPENRDLFPGLTVMQHLILGLPRRAKPAELDWVLDLLPALRRIGDRRAGLLSGGEQQMLATARALVRRPQLLLVDELSLGLAPLIVADLLRLIRQLADDHGTAILLVEQHVEMTLAIADKVLVLSHGELVLQDTADRLRGDVRRIEATYLGYDVEELSR
jgi:branched-chain amino acid transport system ATP-binding protein